MKVILAVVSSLVLGCVPTQKVITEPVETETPVPLPEEPPVIKTCCELIGMKTKDNFSSVSTSYYPDPSPLEGGFVDRKGKPLKTLQQFIAGKADAVTVAMDIPAFPYGQVLCSPTLNQSYSSRIKLEVKDTGGAFKGKGRSRIDVCSGSKKDSLDGRLNKRIDLEVCE